MIRIPPYQNNKKKWVRVIESKVIKIVSENSWKIKLSCAHFLPRWFKSTCANPFRPLNSGQVSSILTSIFNHSWPSLLEYFDNAVQFQLFNELRKSLIAKNYFICACIFTSANSYTTLFARHENPITYYHL